MERLKLAPDPAPKSRRDQLLYEKISSELNEGEVQVLHRKDQKKGASKGNDLVASMGRRDRKKKNEGLGGGGGGSKVEKFTRKSR